MIMRGKRGARRKGGRKTLQVSQDRNTVHCAWSTSNLTNHQLDLGISENPLSCLGLILFASLPTHTNSRTHPYMCMQYIDIHVLNYICSSYQTVLPHYPYYMYMPTIYGALPSTWLHPPYKLCTTICTYHVLYTWYVHIVA